MAGAGGRLAANVCGDRVLMALREARPAGLSTAQLVAATGMTLYQVRKGLLYIRETAAMANLEPLTWTRGDGWRLASDPAEWVAYTAAVCHQMLVRTRRLITSTAAPAVAARPDDEDAQTMLDLLTGVKAGLSQLAKGY
ncbi:hypothetical protein GCM10009678_54090 [Actinomadura kijaniata]|uniref:RacP protein n=1 Tax=Actinomadura namibiensis TaxID=182080 RepID=A0A7W3LRG8_ACTNM|nr:hypothetical protein [Actinomadura namibiensis]MBA8952953.1 hypothetical protein [Actinomadura namibiensis]